MVRHMIALHTAWPRSGAALRCLTLSLSMGMAVLSTACAMPGGNPVDWYHSLEGGPIADQRPPPPLVNAPYPNLSTVPQRPPTADQVARGAIAAGLVADRTNAQYAASLTPMPAALPPPHPMAMPAMAGGGDESSASMPAATPTPPRHAATQPVERTALPPPAPVAAAPAAIAASGAARVDTPVAQARPAEPTDTLPSMAAAPPPMPALPGLPTVTTPTPPPAAPLPAPFKSAAAALAAVPAPVPPPLQTPVAGPGAPAPAMPDSQSAPVLIAFGAGSDTLPANALGALKVLSRLRGVHTVAVAGYGDVDGSDARAQAAGLPLALARARAIAGYLLAVGVPPAAIRIGAEAQGHGGAARILN
jgi:outer membrane protein OmpA-like peptidoglycan-associated protein